MVTVTRNRSLKRELDLTENNNTYFVIYNVHFFLGGGGGVVVAESDGVICIYIYAYAYIDFVNVSFIKL